MKANPICLFFLALLLSGCGFQEREKAIKQREAALAQKEQALMEKENALNLQEAALQKRQERLDSTSQDSLLKHRPKLLGSWNAAMNCTETTCPGSAVGDSRTETWQISYEQGFLQAKALDNNQVTRIYTGSEPTQPGQPLQLTATVEGSSVGPATRIDVRLSRTDSTTWVGQRIITRQTGCRIVYNLKLTR